MMTRDQRIEFEILDCTLNRAIATGGWPTSLEVFLLKVCDLFPDVELGELIIALKRLSVEGALTLWKKEPGPTYCDYRDDHDDEIFFHDRRCELHFQEASFSRVHFARLTALIELPGTRRR